MRRSIFFLPNHALTVAAALLLPLTGAACGRTACFEWTPPEGACPSQEEAIIYFSDPSCPGSVRSVESEGSFDGQLCCYSVTHNDTTVVGQGCDVGVGGFGSGEGGFGSAVAVGVGGSSGEGGFGTGGGSSCVFCSDVLFNGQPFEIPLCPGSDVAFKELSGCACSACDVECNDNFCSGGPMSADCEVCMQDQAAGCPIQFEDCLAN
jgi:hypothetical protein